MKTAKKDPPKPLNFFFISKRWLPVPDPVVPGAFTLALERKGRTYVNPENANRLRGKSALRIAKAARVAAGPGR